MSISDIIENELRHALALISASTTPPRLRQALEHALFGGGARVRPWLALAVAAACGNRRPRAAAAAAGAVEMLHCASLVHDDLPCFDDAATRRGRPSVHAAYGEQVALLAGDALIVGAFALIANRCESTPQLLAPLTHEIAGGVGSARGIVAGQAWESESHAELRSYHRLKTGALFEAAVRAGAIAGGGDPDLWVPLGRRLGEAYQVADDIADAVSRDDELGKPAGQDASLGRPNAVRELGLVGAYARLEGLCGAIEASIPSCHGRKQLAAHLTRLCGRLFPARRTDPSGAYPTTSSGVSAA